MRRSTRPSSATSATPAIATPPTRSTRRPRPARSGSPSRTTSTPEVHPGNAARLARPCQGRMAVRRLLHEGALARCCQRFLPFNLATQALLPRQLTLGANTFPEFVQLTLGSSYEEIAGFLSLTCARHRPFRYHRRRPLQPQQPEFAAGHRDPGRRPRSSGARPRRTSSPGRSRRATSSATTPPSTRASPRATGPAARTRSRRTRPPVSRPPSSRTPWSATRPACARETADRMSSASTARSSTSTGTTS